MPGCVKCLFNAVIEGSSEPPKLFDTANTPVVADAASSAAIRSLSPVEFASTSRMWQSGQAAETMSRSRLISSAQPGSAAGNGPPARAWLTLWKQPLPVVQAGRPKWLR